MYFTKFVSVLAAASSALALSINSPSPSGFWVQFTSNVITWSFTSGDPQLVDIFVTNPNNTFLNGPFAIAQNVNVSNGTFTVTNVTLIQGSGFVVEFVNPNNNSQVFASSQSFNVDAPGTPPATVSTAAPSSTATSPANSTSATSTATGAAGASNKTSDATSLFANSPFPVYLLATSGMIFAGAAAAL